MKKKSPMLEVYGLTEKEAKEVEKATEEIILKFKRRNRIIKELKKKFKGNKLLYAVGFAEYWAGHAHAMAKVSIHVSEDKNS